MKQFSQVVDIKILVSNMKNTLHMSGSECVPLSNFPDTRYEILHHTSRRRTRGTQPVIRWESTDSPTVRYN